MSTKHYCKKIMVWGEKDKKWKEGYVFKLCKSCRTKLLKWLKGE